MTTAQKTALAATTVILFWASAFVAIRVALIEVAPGHLALARYAVAAAVFLAIPGTWRLRLDFEDASGDYRWSLKAR